VRRVQKDSLPKWPQLPGAIAIATLCGSALALDPTQVFDKVSGSVWVVRALDASERPFAQGSAVVIAPGKLVTNCHVLAKAVTVQVVHAHRMVCTRHPAPGEAGAPGVDPRRTADK
jgi:S1-C subfamily serine protease